jgi:PTS system ascorbate-specific IIB component
MEEYAMIKKIMCFCGSGLGTSFVMEMNIKKALKAMNITNVEVFHSTIDDVVEGAADVYVCSADLVPNAKKAGGKVIGLTNMVAIKEVSEKLKALFEEENA